MILLAEDSKNIREYCRDELVDDGYRVVAVGDGVEAWEAFCKEMPNVVVLDICMPRMNGLEVLERIRSAAPQIPVILFSAHDHDYVDDGRIRLATACVEKTADLTELKQAIASAGLGYEVDRR